MRKFFMDQPAAPTRPPIENAWLDVQQIAAVEVSSEEAHFPIEGVFQTEGPGWRAASSGEQVIRLIFDCPQALRRIWLQFIERKAARTQEFVLRWSPDGQSFRDLLRQQWVFSPGGSITEIEDYAVHLTGVKALELAITPDISNGPTVATLAGWRLG